MPYALQIKKKKAKAYYKENQVNENTHWAWNENWIMRMLKSKYNIEGQVLYITN